ncbi:helix-turn-helix domain-containing protein [Paenibacillus sp. MSJ-34]|uniref:helix-turn-helix domain-containing protein n=1 Tax=Paenibacillus sp. MSJ-34 TaxID=2841529 RepID=UPI001C0FF2E7|nr:helix-turn-helix transcriptional regulator [Paenibacillus sp. MSJ-34]MBU5442047.1 helix-turn-helix domain-containing protein [Paenibacillus sp. MSJ-34]
MKTIGERIAFLRESKGLNQRELMKLLSFNNLSRFERNEMKPGIEIVVALAEFFDVSTDWLLTGKERTVDAKSHQSQVSASDLELLAKFHQLEEKEQWKIEERIEVLLELADKKSDSSSKQRSSTSSSTDGREEAASKPA